MGRVKELWMRQIEDQEPESPDEGDGSELCPLCMFFHAPTHECVKETKDV